MMKCIAYYILTLMILSISIPLCAEEVKTIEMLTASNQRLKATSLTIERKGSSYITNALIQGTAHNGRLDELVEINFAASYISKTSEPQEVQIILTNNDIIYGRFVSKSETSIHIQSKSLGDISYKIEDMRALYFRSREAESPRTFPDQSEEDILLFATGDMDNGVLMEMDDKHILFHSSTLDTKRTILTQDIVSIRFARMTKSPIKPEGIHQSILLTDGSHLSGSLNALTQDHLSLTTSLQKNITLPTSAIASIFIINGKVVWVSDMQPSSVQEQIKEVRSLQSDDKDMQRMPYRNDRNVLGGPISIRGILYKKGIGVHSRSELTYDLNGSYQSFISTIGIDDCALGSNLFSGNVVYSLYVDNAPNPAYTSGDIDGTMPGKEIHIDVTKANKITLVVDFGQEGNIRDYANWAGARLVKK